MSIIAEPDAALSQLPADAVIEPMLPGVSFHASISEPEHDHKRSISSFDSDDIDADACAMRLNELDCSAGPASFKSGCVQKQHTTLVHSEARGPQMLKPIPALWGPNNLRWLQHFSISPALAEIHFWVLACG